MKIEPRAGILAGLAAITLLMTQARAGTPVVGLAMTIIMALVVLLVFTALSLVSAVIAARIYASRV